MLSPICNINACVAPAGKRRGMCDRHYQRWKATGSTEPRRNSPFKSLHQRLWEKADCAGEDECWIWQAAINSKGYGTTTDIKRGPGRARRVYAHRLAWEVERGPIPPGMVIDHTCYVRSCINPAHMRLATPGQNNENREGASRNSQTGMRNVYPTGDGRYVVQVKRIHIGIFEDVHVANAAAVEARRDLMPFALDSQKLEGVA